MTTASTRSGWRYWIEVPSELRREVADPVIGTLLLRPVEGEDIAIELCPGYAPGAAAQNELRLRIGEAVGNSEESQEIFDFVSFLLPDLIDARSTRSARADFTNTGVHGSAPPVAEASASNGRTTPR